MLKYPKFKKSEKKTNYFSNIIDEPYFDLEDINSVKTKNWVYSENKLTEDFLSKIEFRDKINLNLKNLWNYPKQSPPIKAGNFYYYFKNSGLLNQSILYRKKNLDEINEELFLDPNTFSKDQTANLSSLSFSKNGKYLVYGISRLGSIYSEIIIYDTKLKKQLDKKIKNIPFDSSVGYTKVIWFKSGFFYSKFDSINSNENTNKNRNSAKIYFHKIGTNINLDELIYEDKKNPTISFGLSNSFDEKYLYIYPSFGNHLNSILIRDNLDLTINIKKIIDDFKFESEIFYEDKNNFVYILTNRNNSNKKVFKIDLNNFEESNWICVLEEGKFFLENIFYYNKKFICHYLKNASSKLEIYNINFKFESIIELPSLGTVFNFNFDNDKNQLYFAFTSFLYPSIILKYSFNSNSCEIYKKSAFKFDSSKYETKQIWYESKDKTKIPMFIVCKKNLKLDGNNPTILYGYGGFNISLTPFFSIENILFLENGGIYVMSNLRGGGEFGRKWHEGGILKNKQNVFDDFIYAAKYLIKNNYTCSNKLAIFGGSNGGLLIGACLVQKPNLFKVAVAVVGVLDMLKYHKFGAGADWIADYGCSINEKDFNYLIKYSPVHNVEFINYPSILIMTSDSDDNVSSSHSYKFTALLQEKNQNNSPILLRVETGAGHHGGNSTKKAINEICDRLTFIFNELEMNFNKN